MKPERPISPELPNSWPLGGPEATAPETEPDSRMGYSEEASVDAILSYRFGCRRVADVILISAGSLLAPSIIPLSLTFLRAS